MPLATDPSETFEVSLDSDAAKPEATRPGFRFRYLSSRACRANEALMKEWDAYYAGGAQAPDLAAYEALITRTYQTLAAHCAGVVRVAQASLPAPGAADLDAILNDSEARELLTASTRMSRLQPTEKKDSGSPSPGATADSAPAPVHPAAAATPSKTGPAPSSIVPPAPAGTPAAASAAATPKGARPGSSS